MVTSKETNDQLVKVECVGVGWMSVPYTVNTVPRKTGYIFRRFPKSCSETVCNNLECCSSCKCVLNFSKRLFYGLFLYSVAVFSSLSSPVDTLKNKIASGKKLLELLH